MKVDYEAKFKEKLQKNIEQFKREIHNGENIERINKFSEKYNLSSKEVIEKAKKDNLFALHFAKDPSRQNFHEDTAAQYLKSLSEISDFKQLPKGGKNAKTVISGMIVSYSQAQKTQQKQKTIDFEFNINYNNRCVKVYASHKFTKDSGGSQDNQYENIINFMSHAKDNIDENTYFLAICDGPYYKQKYQNGDNKLDKLNKLFFNERKIRAATIEEIDTLLDEITKKSM